MASLPPISRIVKEDFAGQPWAEKLLWPINRFFESVVQALNRGLTVQENLAAQVKQLSFTTKATVADTFPLRFLIDTPSRPTDLVMTKLNRADGTVITAGTTVDWRIADNGTEILIQSISNLTASENYIARFMVFSEVR